MNTRFVELFVCLDCKGALKIIAKTAVGDDVLEGSLCCTRCNRSWAICNRIPRFIDGPTYAESFGWQWLKFSRLQRDSYNQTTLVRDTILKRSGWRPEDLRDKCVLECGCGSGNDSEVLASMSKMLVSVDLSESVDSLPAEFLSRENVLVMRADLHHLPLRADVFDIVYCHRVIQHTPQPEKAFGAMARHLRAGGVFFLHTYDTHWKSLLQYKYWLRPLVRSLSYTSIYKILCVVGPVFYHLPGVLNRLAFLRRLVRLLIPFENYGRALRRAGASLTWRERYQYSLLVTFDALTPRHDNPSSPAKVATWFQNHGFIDVVFRARNPVIALGVKSETTLRVDC